MYGTATVVNGRTQMKIAFDGAALTVRNRYAHVYVAVADQWRMVAAQGTQIVE